MSSFLKEMIIKKMKELSVNEVLFYAQENGFNITQEEAQHIVHYLKTNEVNPFHANDRMEMIQQLAQITNLETAKKAQKLFIDIIQSYGLEHLFNQ